MSVLNYRTNSDTALGVNVGVMAKDFLFFKIFLTSAGFFCRLYFFSLETGNKNLDSNRSSKYQIAFKVNIDTETHVGRNSSTEATLS